MALILSGDTGVPASGMPAGSVIQTVQISTTTQTPSTSTTWLDTGLSGAITPSSTTSKILVLFTSPCLAEGNCELQLQLLRNGSAITSSYKMVNNAANIWSSITGNVLDSPASNSAVTYTVQVRRVSGTGTVYFGTSNDPSTSRMILQEIKV